MQLKLCNNFKLRTTARKGYLTPRFCLFPIFCYLSVPLTHHPPPSFPTEILGFRLVFFYRERIVKSYRSSKSITSGIQLYNKNETILVCLFHTMFSFLVILFVMQIIFFSKCGKVVLLSQPGIYLPKVNNRNTRTTCNLH